jgi:hypothetical protein
MGGFFRGFNYFYTDYFLRRFKRGMWAKMAQFVRDLCVTTTPTGWHRDIFGSAHKK